MTVMKPNWTNGDLKAEIEKATAEAKGNMVIVASSHKGTEVIVGDKPLYEESLYKQIYGSAQDFKAC